MVLEGQSLLCSCRTWTELVSNYCIMLDNYKQHCVSRSALMLHLHGTSEKDMPHALQQVCGLPCIMTNVPPRHAACWLDSFSSWSGTAIATEIAYSHNCWLL